MTDYGPSPAVRARWNTGSRLRAVKRYVWKALRSIKEGLGSVRAFAAMMRPIRKPKRVVDMSPEQKVIFVAMLSGDGRR